MKYYITPEKWQEIPEAYKTEIGGKRACFICFLTSYYDVPGATLCFEGEHFEITDKFPEFTETEDHNGYFEAQCIIKKKDVDTLYHKAGLKVYEYKNPDENARYGLWRLYAYSIGDEFVEGLSHDQLEPRLKYFVKTWLTSGTRSECY